MSFSLGATELKAFNLITLSSAGVTVNELAVSLGVSKSFCSKIVAKLKTSDLLDIKNSGKNKLTHVSNSAVASALKQLISLNSHVDFGFVLTSSGVKVLIALSSVNCSAKQISAVTGMSLITTRRTITKLLNLGVLKKPRHSLFSITLPGLKEFVAILASNLAQKKIKVNGSVLTFGAECLIRTRQLIGKIALSTGLSAFYKYGVEIVETKEKDYYFNLFAEVKNIKMEEAIVHALARARLINSYREVSYALLVIGKNYKKFKLELFKETAACFGIEKQALNYFEFVKNTLLEVKSDIREDFLPDEDEFKKLLIQYEVI